MTTQGFELPQNVREFADKGVDQARSAVGSLLSGMIKGSEQIQGTATSVQSTLHAAVLKGLDHVQTNANATFDHAQRLSRARDLREAFELQTEFMKGQAATLQAQLKDLGSLAQPARQ